MQTLQDEIIEDLEMRLEHLNKNITYSEEVYEEKICQLKKKNSFNERLIDGFEKAFTYLSIKNKQIYEKKLAKIKEEHVDELGTSKEEYNSIKSMIAKLRKDS